MICPLINFNSLIIKGSNYWKLTEDLEEDGYPRKIQEDWPGLPDNIDAAVTWTDNGMTYFFKGDKYWKFDNQEPIKDYPKLISEGFDGIPNNVDAAFVWGGNGKIYFFKGVKYFFQIFVYNLNGLLKSTAGSADFPPLCTARLADSPLAP